MEDVEEGVEAVDRVEAARPYAERLAAVIGGVATVVFGVLALSWPSVTVLVIAVVFGARLVLFGLRMAWSSFRDRDADDGRAAAGASPPGRIRRLGNAVGAVAALLVAVLLATGCRLPEPSTAEAATLARTKVSLTEADLPARSSAKPRARRRRRSAFYSVLEDREQWELDRLADPSVDA